jgi:hypothetical protein
MLWQQPLARNTCGQCVAVWPQLVQTNKLISNNLSRKQEQGTYNAQLATKRVATTTGQFSLVEFGRQRAQGSRLFVKVLD